MPTFIGATRAGDGQTSPTNTLTVPVHASAVAGDLMLIGLDNSDSANTLTTSPPVIRGRDANGANSATWILGKLLTAADISSGSISCVFTAAARCTANSLTFRGAGIPSAAQCALAPETSPTNAPTLPTLTGVVSGASLAALFLRRRSGVSGTVTIPAPYTTPSTSHVGTGYASGVNVYGDVGYVASSAGGSVGGEAGSSGVTAVGNNYLIEVPAGNTTITVPSAAVGAARGAASPAVAVAVPTAYSPARAQVPAATSGASPKVPAAAVGAFSEPAQRGTAIHVDGAFVGGSGAAPTVTVSATIPVPSAYSPIRSRPPGVSASSAIPVPSAQARAAGQPAQPMRIHRYQWWDGTEWQQTTPVVWDGAVWLEVPVTVLEPTPQL